MNNNDDWRLFNQDQYLMKKDLKRSVFKSTENRDHVHCEFCWEKFSEQEGDLREGYLTTDERYWICDRCYSDFKDVFKWEIQR